MSGYYKILVPCLVVSVYSMSTRPEHVIFDINAIVHPDEDAKETLITQELKLSSIRYLARAAFGLKLLRSGILPIGFNALSSPQTPLKRSFFDAMHVALSSGTEHTITYYDKDLGTITLPALMADWLCSNETAPTVRTFEEYLKHSALSKEAQEIYQAMGHATFDEKLFAQTTVLNDKIVKFIQECCEKEINVYCIGNMNGHCFARLRKDPRLKAALSLIPQKHVYLSHQNGLAKPHERFYAAAQAQFGLDKSDLIMCFEDQVTAQHASASTRYLSQKTAIADEQAISETTKLLKQE